MGWTFLLVQLRERRKEALSDSACEERKAESERLSSQKFTHLLSDTTKRSCSSKMTGLLISVATYISCCIIIVMW